MLGHLLRWVVIVAVFYAIFIAFAGDFAVVTVLPLGADGAVEKVANYAYQIRTIFPIFALFWNYFLAFIAVELAFYLWHWIRWFIQHFVS